VARIHRRSGVGRGRSSVESGDPCSRRGATDHIEGTKRDAEHAAAAQVAAVAGGAFGDPTRETSSSSSVAGSATTSSLRSPSARREGTGKWLSSTSSRSLASCLYRSSGRITSSPSSSSFESQATGAREAVSACCGAEGPRRPSSGNGARRPWQAIAVNPVDAVDRPVIPRSEIRSVTPDQARVLLRALRSEPLRTAAAGRPALWSSVSELLAVRWSDIDWDHGR